MCVRGCTCMHMCADVCTCVYVCVHVCTCVYMCMCVPVCTHMYTHTHMYIPVTHVPTCTHMYTQVYVHVHALISDILTILWHKKREIADGGPKKAGS